MRTSTIFGADVHDPKGCRKTLYAKKVCVDFLAPTKGKFWGRISSGRARGYPGGLPGAKTSVKPSKSWENMHFGADIHDPKAQTSMTPGVFKKLRSEKLRAEFSFPTKARRTSLNVVCDTQHEFQTHLNLHSPVRVGQTVVVPSERVHIWVCLFPYGWSYPGVRLQIWVSFRPTQTELCKFGWVWSSPT